MHGFDGFACSHKIIRRHLPTCLHHSIDASLLTDRAAHGTGSGRPASVCGGGWGGNQIFPRNGAADNVTPISNIMTGAYGHIAEYPIQNQPIIIELAPKC